MKHFTVILTLLLATLQAHAQRDLYEHYYPRQDLLVAYAHGYRLDSANRVDVIVLHADDTTVWVRLLEEFGLEEFWHLQHRYWAEGQQKDVRFSRSVCRDDLCAPAPRDMHGAMVYPLSCLIFGSNSQRTLCLFYPDNPHHADLILAFGNNRASFRKLKSLIQ